MKTLKRITKCLISSGFCLVLTLIMSFGLLTSATAQSFPERISLLGAVFQPEGITLGTGHTAYVGSLAGGNIYEVDLRTGAVNLLVQGLGPGLSFAVGLDFDERSGYLFVAGGYTGDGRVYDTHTGALVNPLPFVAPLSNWINDVVVTREAAYFTNSFVGEIYKVPLDSQGVPSGGWEVLELGPEWINVVIPGEIIINANGIVATPDGRTLIVVNYATGRLYTVDPDIGLATEIDLGGVIVPFGDGLVLRGKTLYVVQNFVVPPMSPGQISVFTLSPDYSTATLTRVLSADDPFVPSTADAFGPWLYAVNARFDVCFPGNPGCPLDTPFEIVRVDQQ